MSCYLVVIEVCHFDGGREKYLNIEGVVSIGSAIDCAVGGGSAGFTKPYCKRTFVEIRSLNEKELVRT